MYNEEQVERPVAPGVVINEDIGAYLMRPTNPKHLIDEETF